MLQLRKETSSERKSIAAIKNVSPRVLRFILYMRPHHIILDSFYPLFVSYFHADQNPPVLVNELELLQGSCLHYSVHLVILRLSLPEFL